MNLKLKKSFQAKEIIYNVNRYFIAEKVKKELSLTENLKYAYDLATLLTVWQPQQLERC